jgi:hypothetical protein
MSFGANDSGGDHAVDGRAGDHHFLDLQPEARETSSEIINVVPQRGEVVQPGQDESHGVLRTAR